MNQDDVPTSVTGRAWRRARRIVLPVVLAYLFILGWMMLQETQLVYPIPPVARGDWQPAGLGHQDVRFESADGTKLHGWFVPHPSPKRALVYFHGNGEQVGDNAWLVALLRDELEASVFIFDYRGYGHSEGTPHEAGCIADGRAAQRWLAQEMGIGTSDVVLMGRSLGSGVAVALAADPEQGASALVLENAFPSMPEVAAYHYPWLPVRWLMRNRYDSERRIQGYDGPLVMSHGTRDSIIPIELGRRLYDAAPSHPKRFIELPGQNHNDAPPNDYYRQIAQFLDQAGMPPPPVESGDIP